MNFTLIQIVSFAVTFILFVFMMALMAKHRGIRPAKKIEKWRYVAFAIPGIVMVLLIAILFRDDLVVGTGRTVLLNSVLWAVEVWFILYTFNISKMPTMA